MTADTVNLTKVFNSFNYRTRFFNPKYKFTIKKKWKTKKKLLSHMF